MTTFQKNQLFGFEAEGFTVLSHTQAIKSLSTSSVSPSCFHTTADYICLTRLSCLAVLRNHFVMFSFFNQKSSFKAGIKKSAIINVGEVGHLYTVTLSYTIQKIQLLEYSLQNYKCFEVNRYIYIFFYLYPYDTQCSVLNIARLCETCVQLNSF